MKNIISSIIVGFQLISSVYSACDGDVVTRREIRDLSDDERTAYFNAIKKLHDPKNDQFSKFSGYHYNNANEAHGVPAFFPWHRQFLSLYEKQLQAIDPSVVLPYWDWSIDSQAPEQSPIFTNSFLGGNGAGSNHCLKQGTFANWQASVPNRHCLKRNFDNGDTISSFYAPEMLEAILSQSNTYDNLRTGIEGGPHGAVHTGIGGEGGDMTAMYSTNDPIFYLHHAFIDLLWSEWQTRNPSLAKTYNGDSVDSSDTMIPFDTTVDTTFDTTDLCYNYPRYGADLPESQNANLRRSDHRSLKSFIRRFNPRNRHPKVSPTDRETIGKIRTPKPLPNRFIEMNRLNVTQVREMESLLSNFAISLNSMPNFKPRSRLPRW